MCIQNQFIESNKKAVYPLNKSCQCNRIGSCLPRILKLVKRNEKPSITTVRRHLTPIKMAIIKQNTNNKCRRGCGESGTHVHCWWECQLVRPLWKTVWSFLKKLKIELPSVQFSSVAQLCPTLCDPMNHSTPGLPVHHQLPEFTQTQVHRVGDAIQPSYPLSSPSPPAPNPSQHQSLFQWVNSSHEVAKVLEFQL